MRHSVQSQAAPGTPQQLRCFHPGVGHCGRLYLPTAPGTLKSGAPPQAGFEYMNLQSAIRKMNIEQA